MTAAEVYELTTQGGATDFAWLIEVCASLGPYCLIGGLAVNCYVEPVYTLDADLVLVSGLLPSLDAILKDRGFKIEQYPHSFNAFSATSQLRIQFTKDLRYQEFIPRSVEAEVLGRHVRVASLNDVVQGKLWAYLDPQRRFSKRKKDELDLIRLAEAYPALRSMYPAQLNQMIDAG